ncbi:MAG: hypothetical protein WBL85_07040 [Sedimentisphaerales bacterium]
MSSKEIFKLAEENGFKETTLAKARKELSVKCFPEFDDDGNKCWHWRLPKPEGSEKKQLSLSEMMANLNKMKQSIRLPKISP